LFDRRAPRGCPGRRHRRAAPPRPVQQHGHGNLLPSNDRCRHRPTSPLVAGLLLRPTSRASDRPGSRTSRALRLVPSESGAKLRGTAASAARAGAAGVPVDARSPRHITGGSHGTPGAGAAAKGARIQAERPQGVRLAGTRSRGCPRPWSRTGRDVVSGDCLSRTHRGGSQHHDLVIRQSREATSARAGAGVRLSRGTGPGPPVSVAGRAASWASSARHSCPPPPQPSRPRPHPAIRRR
jgi:hypothetical protein